MAKLISYFRTVSETDKNKAIEKLIADSTPDFDFFLLATLSILMATFGMLLDSAAIVIGSMLIAPILHPILSLALGVSLPDYKLMTRSLFAIFKALVLGVGGAVIITVLFSDSAHLTSEIVARIEPNLLYFAVAIISGVAVSYALVKPNLSDTLPGVAVSVALIPPLAVIGIGIAKLDVAVIAGSAVLFLINVIGIVFASMVSFSLMNIQRNQQVAKTAVKKEDERAEREEAKAQKIVDEDKKAS